MADNKKTLIEELEKRLLWYREEATEEEFDAEDVDAICTMLQKLLPAEEPHRTREEAYENIMRQIRLEEEELEKGGESEAYGNEAEKNSRTNRYNFDEDSRTDKKSSERDGRAARKKPDGDSIGDAEEPDKNNGEKKRRFPLGKRGLRAAVIFIAVVGILGSLNMVTYARENKSLFTIILERVGWLQIEKEKGEEISVIGNDRLDETFYDSWGDLDREVKERITVPVYIPEGYSLYGLRCWNGEDETIIQSNYYDQGNGHLFVEITLWEDNEDHYRETVMDETIYTLLSEFSDEKNLYYEYDDEYVCLAFGEKILYRIGGNIPLEEIIKIRERLGNI